jgi:asparagine synthase (glutamine-hydrolysing)
MRGMRRGSGESAIMCGISGQLTLDGRAVDRRLVERMTQRLHHRGPDDAGFFFGPQIGLGSRRLAIIDLHSGRQPMTDESGSLHLVSNNEIYNYRELRQELAARGSRFTSQSDTEVILRLYESEGPGGVRKLEGMFASAIWDARDESLFLVRDRFGVKPLYYYQDATCFLFASELKALFEYRALDRTLDLAAADQYFARLALPEPRSILKNVRKLPAGHYLTVRRGVTRVERYWRPQFGGRSRVALNSDERLRDELQRSVSISMRSDVPVGLLLSGGLDSSSVAAFAARESGERLHAFSAGFREADFDESTYSRLVAKRFGIRHHRVLVTRNKATDIAAHLTSVMDEPFADSSSVAMYAVCELAAAHVKTVLSGDGADELLGGYPWHVVEAPSHDPVDGHPSGVIFNRDEREALYSPAWKRELARHKPRRVPASKELSPLNRSLLDDVRTYLPSDILFKSDRVSMLHSLELRVPFLNHPLAELLMRLPDALKVDGAIRKVLLRRIMAGVLPPEILQRPKKGFSIPMDLWLWERGRWRDMVYDTLFSARTRQREQFDMTTLERMGREHDRMEKMHGYRLWTVFIFEMWQRRFLHAPGGRMNG